MPSTNSLHSLYNFVHVPWVQAQLSRIQARVGKDQFPIVKTTMLPNAASLRRYRDFPAIIISGNRNDARLRVRNREQVNTLTILPLYFTWDFRSKMWFQFFNRQKSTYLCNQWSNPFTSFISSESVSDFDAEFLFKRIQAECIKFLYEQTPEMRWLSSGLSWTTNTSCGLTPLGNCLAALK